MNIERKFCESCKLETDHVQTKVYDEDQDPDSGIDALVCMRCGHSDQEPEIIHDPRGFPNLGRCCNCDSEKEVFNIIFLNRKLPADQAGKGWGCLACNLPADGVVSVLCNKCFFELYETDSKVLERKLTKYCVGFPMDNIRAEISPEMEIFKHDISKHNNEESINFI